MKKHKGNVIIEMAFILPVFLIIIMAIIELNRYYWTGYWLNFCLQDAIISEAFEPGIGVKSRLSNKIDNLLIDKSLLTINEERVRVGRLEITQYNISYPARFYLLPNKTLTLQSNNWLADNENDIN